MLPGARIEGLFNRAYSADKGAADGLAPDPTPNKDTSLTNENKAEPREKDPVASLHIPHINQEPPQAEAFDTDIGRCMSTIKQLAEIVPALKLAFEIVKASVEELDDGKLKENFPLQVLAAFTQCNVVECKQKANNILLWVAEQDRSTVTEASLGLRLITTCIKQKIDDQTISSLIDIFKSRCAVAILDRASELISTWNKVGASQAIMDKLNSTITELKQERSLDPDDEEKFTRIVNKLRSNIGLEASGNLDESWADAREKLDPGWFTTILVEFSKECQNIEANENVFLKLTTMLSDIYNREAVANMILLPYLEKCFITDCNNQGKIEEPKAFIDKIVELTIKEHPSVLLNRIDIPGMQNPEQPSALLIPMITASVPIESNHRIPEDAINKLINFLIKHEDTGFLADHNPITKVPLLIEWLKAFCMYHQPARTLLKIGIEKYPDLLTTHYQDLVDDFNCKLIALVETNRIAIDELGKDEEHAFASKLAYTKDLLRQLTEWGS